MQSQNLKQQGSDAIGHRARRASGLE